jgi:hypothetical protein
LINNVGTPGPVPGVFARGLCRVPSAGRLPAAKKEFAMAHKYAVGTQVNYSPTFTSGAARGTYTIVRTLPIENDNRIAYRIKSAAETFERIAEEHQLSRAS